MSKVGVVYFKYFSEPSSQLNNSKYLELKFNFIFNFIFESINQPETHNRAHTAAEAIFFQGLISSFLQYFQSGKFSVLTEAAFFLFSYSLMVKPWELLSCFVSKHSLRTNCSTLFNPWLS